MGSLSRGQADSGLLLDDAPAANMVERVQDMYMALMESEECMERIACEVGGLVTDAGISKSMAKMAGQFVPKKYAKMMRPSTTARTARRTTSVVCSKPTPPAICINNTQ